MKKLLLILIFFLLAIIADNLSQKLLVSALPQDENLVVKRQLQLLNKPARHSFVTQHGDTMDCVEIDKQLAFDHPLLKNHSIQIKPSFEIPKPKKLNDKFSSIITASQLLPKNKRCPNGTVLIKRIQEGDLQMTKYSKLLGVSLSNSNSNSSFKLGGDALSNGPPNLIMHNEIAALVTTSPAPNTGAASIINLWSPWVTQNQFSDVSFFVGHEEASVNTALVTGWIVNLHLYPYSTRLYTYWTKDNGQSTGCYNILCPGFVQTSKMVTLGQTLSPISKHLGHQYFVDLQIIQDKKTQNWLLLYGGEHHQVGYWPKELFKNLENGASKAGWGGEISSPVTELPPGMGAGHFPEENYRSACLMKYLKLFNPSGKFPLEKDMRYYLTKRKCYRALYGPYFLTDDDDPPEGEWGDYVFIGGPQNCTA